MVHSYCIKSETNGLTRIEDKEQLGSGGFGTVYKCFYGKDAYAIKYMKNDNGLIPSSTIREIDGLTQLSKSKHVLDLYEIEFDKKYVKIILKLGDMDLKYYIKKGLSNKEIKSISKQICQGIYDCVQKNIIHRDIKLNNIIMLGDKVKLSDFGLCRSDVCTIENNIELTIQYTLQYRPIEVLQDEMYTNKADIWALGITILSIVNGKRFFRIGDDYPSGYDNDEETKATKEMINEIYRIFPDRISTQKYLRKKFPQIEESLIDLLSWMLELDPDNRPDIYQVLTHEYFKAKPKPLKSCYDKLLDRLYIPDKNTSVENYLEVANELYDITFKNKSTNEFVFYHALQLYCVIKKNPKIRNRVYLAACWYISQELKEDDKLYHEEIDEFLEYFVSRDYTLYKVRNRKKKLSMSKIKNLVNIAVIDIITQLKGGTYISTALDFLYVSPLQFNERKAISSLRKLYLTDKPLKYTCQEIADMAIEKSLVTNVKN